MAGQADPAGAAQLLGRNAHIFMKQALQLPGAYECLPGKTGHIHRSPVHKDIPYDAVYGNLREQLMGTGILICGLNGSGKSTLGKALHNHPLQTQKQNFHAF